MQQAELGEDAEQIASGTLPGSSYPRGGGFMAKHRDTRI